MGAISQAEAEQQQAKELRYISAMERVQRAIVKAPTLDTLLTDVLDEMLSIFDCERAWLLFPCDPEAESFAIPMERTRPGFPGLASMGKVMPMDPFTRNNFVRNLASDAPMRFDPEVNPFNPDDLPFRLFQVKSILSTVVHPRIGKPWALGIHHCVAPRVYADDVRIIDSIAARVADGLGSFLAVQKLQRLQRQFEQAQSLAHVGSFEWDESTATRSASPPPLGGP
jgi:hypothetical protein